MKAKMFLFFCSIFITTALFAGSVRLTNDSPFKLTAVIISATGDEMAQYTLDPRQSVTWENYNTSDLSGSVDLQPTWPETPYTVVWYCQDGGDYSVSTNVGSGGLSTAQSGSGTRFCKPQKKKPGQQKGAVKK